MELRDNAFVVTGAASGLGAATARMIVAEGGKVVLADLAGDGNALAAQYGDDAIFIRTDVCDSASAQSAIDTCVARFGAIRGLVNCAGIAPAEKVVGRTGPHSLEMFCRTVAINLTGTFNMVRLAAHAMAAQDPTPDGERGVIVNTASVAAFEGQVGQAAYAASKGGVASMTLPLARELARHAIRVVAIAPGLFDTAMLAGMSDELRESLGKMTVFPTRLGRPEEFAAMVRAIFANPMLNGSTIRLDGAMRMQAV